ncbi:MAG: hypothetical protein QXR87_06600 [Candidatus Hadarchaeales archaeon]
MEPVPSPGEKIACALCGGEGKIFHHWDYQTGTGCHLCVDCHTYIHHATGIENWPWSKVIQSLTYRFLKLKGSSLPPNLKASDLTKLLIKKFNIPFEERFVYTHVYTVLKRFPLAPSPWVFQGITASPNREPSGKENPTTEGGEEEVK